MKAWQWSWRCRDTKYSSTDLRGGFACLENSDSSDWDMKWNGSGESVYACRSDMWFLGVRGASARAILVPTWDICVYDEKLWRLDFGTSSMRAVPARKNQKTGHLLLPCTPPGGLLAIWKRTISKRAIKKSSSISNFSHNRKLQIRPVNGSYSLHF